MIKKSKKILIANRVFALNDLVRVANIFSEQSASSLRSKENFRASYRISFSDKSTIESSSSDILSEEYLIGPVRPLEVRFTFHNYDSDSNLSFQLNHGDGYYGNIAEASSEDNSWLSYCFLAVKDAIETAKPQAFFFKRHPTLLLNLIAIGIGSLYLLLTNLAIGSFFTYTNLETVIQPLSQDSPWLNILARLSPIVYLVQWLLAWAMGHLLGAYAVRSWLLSLWPNIEFDFGAKHLLTEQHRRTRLILVVTLTIVPIVVNLLYDISKRITF